jgi:hypothetical protein
MVQAKEYQAQAGVGTVVPETDEAHYGLCQRLPIIGQMDGLQNNNKSQVS